MNELISKVAQKSSQEEIFWGELAQYLAKWQGIKIRHGPGENITFEKAVSR
jgi:hypothetical protein